MIYVDLPLKTCFDEDEEGGWENLRKFKTTAEAVAWLRFHLGHDNVTDEGFVRIIMGADDPVCEACGGMGFLPNCERCDACEFFESDEAAREHIYAMATRRHRPAATPPMLDLSSIE